MCTLEVPPRARSRPRALSRARRSRPRPRRADASFVLCLSLSRSHARDSRVSFRFMSFHSSPAAAVGRRMDALGPLSRAVMTKTKTPTTRSSASLRSSGSSSRVSMRERSRTSRRRRTTTRVGGGEGDFQFDPSALPNIQPVLRSTMTSDVPRPLSCLLYTSPSPRDRQKSRMPSSA